MIGRDNERRVLGADEAAHHEESEVFAKADRESLGLRGLDFGLLQGNGFVRPQRDSAREIRNPQNIIQLHRTALR